MSSGDRKQRNFNRLWWRNLAKTKTFGIGKSDTFLSQSSKFIIQYLLFLNQQQLTINQMNPPELKDIANLWFKAFNEHRLEDLLSLYDDEAEHFSPKLKTREPETQGLIKGKNALRIWWNDCFERLPTLQYEVKKLTADSEQVFMEYTRKVSGEEDLQVGEVLEIKNGKIVFSRVYHG